MNKKSTFLTLALGFVFSSAHSQAPTAQDRLQAAFSEQNNLIQNSVFSAFPTRSVGPTVMGGRVTDLAVTKNPKKYYVAFASGGLWVTQNFGATFEPLFDHQDALGIGDIAIAPSNEKVIWVGTGEKNSSRSSYAGSGVYKSTDEGKTWSNMGLSNSQHIGRVVIHPENENIVWVGSMGPLFSYGGDRGLYKTSDGGKTWKRTLFVDDSTGVIDLIIHPKNPSILWAATWQRHRESWNFREDGKGSGIWKSTDAGETWKKVVNGFPQGDFVGRIGLDISPTNPDVVYALLDNQEEVKSEIKKDKNKFYFDDFKAMSKEDFAKADAKKLDQFLKENGFPSDANATSVKADVAKGIYSPKALAEYGGDANSALFTTDVRGAEVYKSTNGGESWSKTHTEPIDGLYFTYGYYFGEIRVDPSNENRIYVLGVPLLASDDSGKTWRRVDHGNVHVDHQAFWINPADSDHLLLGNDGGIYSSFDAGKTWTHHNSIPAGQFYTVMVDNEKPYNIYGGLQDNGVHVGSSKSIPNVTEHWKSIMGGDGMHVAVHPKNANLVYTGFQFGNYYRIDKSKNERTYITPKHKIGSSPYRFNWNTPVVLSPHNPDVVYMGAHKLLRSMNQGTTFSEISPDLTTNFAPQGNVPYSTITGISESPFEFGLIWVGTDDGQLHVTENGGTTWNNVSSSFPKGLWVSKVVASPHQKNAAFVTMTGFRFDHFESYAFYTEDLGKTWNKISATLPAQALNVLIPDLQNPNLLFAGSDHGGFMSFDNGSTWQSMPSGIPNVAVYDLIIHPREHELVIATHGRSMYVMDLKPVREIAKAGLNQELIVLNPNPVNFNSRWGQQSYAYSTRFMPSTKFEFYTAKAQTVSVKLMDDKKAVLKTWEIKSTPGYQTLDWNLVTKEVDGKPEFLGVGSYSVQFKIGKTEKTVTFEVKGRN